MVKLVNRLGITKILPETIIFKRVPFTINLPYQSLIGKSGAILTGEPTIEPREYSLEGRIYYRDKGRIEQELDALLSFLMHPPIEVYRLEHHNKFLLTYPLGAPQDWIDLGAELAISIPMIALDPYWRGEEVEVSVSGTQLVVTEGTAPVKPLIVSTNSVSGLEVNNLTTGHKFELSGGNGVVTVDNLNYDVWVDDVLRLDLVNDSWKLDGFRLQAGKNQIFTSSPIKLVYRPAWY